MYVHKCKFCKQELKFERKGQIGGHVRNCKENPNREEGFKNFVEQAKLRNKIEKEERIEEYYKNPILCLKCSKILEYDLSNKIFCGHSCSAQYNNKLREPRSEESKLKTKLSLIKKYGYNSIEEYIEKNPKSLKRKFRKTRPSKIIINCLVCDKEILVTLKESKKRKYCSGTCRNKIINQIIKGKRSKAELYLEEKLKENFPELEIFYNSRKIYLVAIYL